MRRTSAYLLVGGSGYYFLSSRIYFNDHVLLLRSIITERRCRKLLKEVSNGKLYVELQPPACQDDFNNSGSMTIESMGKLTSLSDAKYTLFPVDYW